MNLFDRVRLLVRSTVNSALRGSLPDIDIAPSERGDKLMDKAQARIEMLQQDIARAEKRGDTELANRLRREISELQATLDKARKKMHQPPAQQPQPESASQADVNVSVSVSTQQQAPSEKTEATTEEPLDNSRVADQIRKMREENQSIR